MENTITPKVTKEEKTSKLLFILILTIIVLMGLSSYLLGDKKANLDYQVLNSKIDYQFQLHNKLVEDLNKLIKPLPNAENTEK